MIREMRPCLACGHPVELICAETNDIDQSMTLYGETFTIHEEEIGWWDTECEKCNLYTPPDLVEARYNKHPDGYWVSFNDSESMWNWLDIFLRECPEAQQKAREILEKCQ